MKPITATVAAAVISGVTMFAVGARTAVVDAFTTTPGVSQPLEGARVATSPVVNQTAFQSAAVQPVAARRVTTRRAAARSASNDGVVYREAETQPRRTWTKSAMIIGGSAASGAGVGGIVKGKKGALIGAAIGGGAASIYEATRRR